ncbi:MAG: HAD family hydrolase [Bacteroidetes bacterium HGW-Bacteroidetes-4]|jgi:putative hydrolase of the HAD superfamily|nr:MAG: HAD family hydrolase [Bacteroidetes bacterium HGW-Bacteroidetes-4]
MKDAYKIIGFDADDTLWVNEPYFREAENSFFQLMASYLSAEKTNELLYQIEMKNLSQYGYGIKSFVLSMIETALKISKNSIPADAINDIIELGKLMLNRPVELLEGMEEILKLLNNQGYKLIVATKGDLLDQERKLAKSNFEKYFHHIEIMSDKKESDYLKLLKHLDIEPVDFLMIGNSYKSDIEPVLNIGGSGIYMPFHTTWIHETTAEIKPHKKMHTIANPGELKCILNLCE